VEFLLLELSGSDAEGKVVAAVVSGIASGDRLGKVVVLKSTKLEVSSLVGVEGRDLPSEVTSGVFLFVGFGDGEALVLRQCGRLSRGRRNVRSEVSDIARASCCYSILNIIAVFGGLWEAATLGLSQKIQATTKCSKDTTRINHRC
jgi:hypothetical protein